MIAHVRIAAVFALLFSILGCAGSPPPKPDWVATPDLDMSSLATFSLGEVANGSSLTILDTKVRNALRTELVKKGYVEAADSPDFVVSYQAVAYEQTKKSNPVNIGLGVGSWGGNVGGSVGTSVGVGGGDSVRLQTRLTIRAVASENNREGWIGTTTTFEQPPEARVVDRAVAGVMVGFPSRSD